MSALASVTSIKTKLGVLVGVSVVVSAGVAWLGSTAGVPLLLTLPVTVLLALTVTQLLAAGMTAPLRAMTAGARRMARGDYDVRVRTDSTDEVGELAAAFNQMSADLARVDQERRGLIATVSHELRTPVASLTAQLDNMVDGVTEPTPEHLRRVLEGAERLGGLLQDLLTLSRLEAGVVELSPAPVTLAELVADCVDEVRRSGRDVPFVVELADDLVVDVDPVRMRQLLTNVLDNAARHTPPGGEVRVLGARTGADEWWFEVRDTGSGVAPADRERVFERFGTDAQGGGTGLGLAVARWVATLHGASLTFVDPVEGESGARLRWHAGGARGQSLPPHPAPTLAPRVPPESGPGPEQESWGGLWPESRPAPDLRLVLAALGVGVLGGALMTFHGPGPGWALVLVVAGALAWFASARRTTPFMLATTGLAAALVATLAVRESYGFAVLAVVVAAGTFLAGATGARTFRGMLLSGLAWPLSSLRGLGWFGRSLGLVGSLGQRSAVLRTTLVSLVGVLVFGALFSSADRTFARWVGALVPTFTFDDVVVRGFVTVAVFGMTLAAVYLARNPARVDLPEPPRLPAANRWEWLVPLLVVDAVFLAFVASQVRVVLGGHDYVRETSGLTYAEYVHQGFAQLVVATLLTLVVLWAAARRAGLDRPDASPSDVRWLRFAGGLLGVLTLGVVAAALTRMAVYQDAYGFTTLRVLVNVFEGWLGLVVLVVMVLGATGRGRLVPRTALLTGAAAVLALVLANPDAFVASRNIDRYEATGKLDVEYLRGLSADAAPVLLERLPAPLAYCLLEGGEPDWARVEGDGELRTPRADWQDRTLADRRAADAVARLLGSYDAGTDCSELLDRHDAVNATG